MTALIDIYFLLAEKAKNARGMRVFQQIDALINL
jgi:hypothetical protein